MDDFFLPPMHGTPFVMNTDEAGNITHDWVYVMCSVCGSAVVNKDFARDAHRRFHWRISQMKTPEELAQCLSGSISPLPTSPHAV